MPALSIIIPVFNSENYLAECINSILAQSFTDFELLLINDGSTDLSGAICDEFAVRYSNVHVFHKNNGGVSSARNKGIEQAQGEYIIFVDSDDWLECSALSFLMTPEILADLVFFGSTFHLPNGDVISYIPEYAKYSSFSEVQNGVVNLITSERHPDYLGFTWNKVFKKGIIKVHNIRFVDHLSYREDEAFTLQYASCCDTLVTVPYVVYNYRVLNSGLTRKQHTKDEFLLLSHAYQESLCGYTERRLQEYVATQIARNYLNAIKSGIDRKERNVIIDELWTFFREEKKADMQLKIKSVYRYLLGCPTSCLMKLYMSIKLIF